MNTKEMLNSRMSYLDAIVSEKSRDIKIAPKGKIKIVKHNSTYQYYIRENINDSQGKYIKKENIALAKALAQKDYDQKVHDLATKELKLLAKLKDLYKNGDCDAYIESMRPYKAELVSPIKEPDEQYIKNWVEQNTKLEETFMSEGLIYDNGKGVMMRSKSEVIISKILDEKGIPYIYEKSVALSKFKTVRPDFTILDVKNRREIYLEHLGLMDDGEYFAKNVKKIADYEKAGIYLGDRLLITYETRKAPLNTHLLEEKLLKML
ncbi:hypothetical protein NXH64_04535 [Butyrivibrio fibrisolvens]|uniref:hypothetical protein n=1 Tax=Pseudobutyrivibrio ruminis TaxID=46206 RepID=UPI0004013108|nr:hypothetical protein [Pseudobutyrivibrio ruminis]MDC7278767.1 hypothetical protein [Butyrivibrio fibrisolvens]